MVQHRPILEQLFIGTSDMAVLLRSRDWSHTSLGAIATWPQSLKTTLNILFHTSCPMLLVWGHDRILFYNDAYATRVCRNKGPLPYGEPLTNIRNVAWSDVWSEVEQVFSTGRSRQQPHYPCSPQDRPNHVPAYTWCYSPLWDENGQISGVLTTGYGDVSQPTTTVGDGRTASKDRAVICPDDPQTARDYQKTLQQREEQLHLITNALPVLIAYVDKDHYYRFNNQTYETWFQQPAATFTNRHIRDVLGDLVYATIRPYVEQALSGARISYESQIPYQEGGTRYIRADYIPHTNSHGEVEGYVSLVSDITERKQVENERKQTEADLQKSDERFRLVTQAVNGLVFDWNLQTGEVYRSERLYDLIGIAAEDAPPGAEWWHERIHPDDIARLQPCITQLLASSDHLYDTEYRVRHQDGHWVDVWEQAFLVRDEHGRVTRIVGCTVDISERKRSEAERKQIEEALRTSEERLRFAVEGANLGTWEYDLVSGQIIWSERAKQMFGVPLEALVDYGTFIQAIHPTDRDRIHAAIEAAITGRSLYDVEMRSVWTDGSVHWIRSIGRTRYDHNGVPTRMIGVVLDITKRKQAEEDLREGERRFRRLVESNMFGVAFGTFTGGIQYVNDYFLHMIGYTRDEIETGQVSWQDITPAEFLPLDERAATELRTRGVATPFEKEYIRKDGSRVPILIGSALRQEPYEQKQEIIAFYIDLTEQKQAAAERERLLQQAQAAREEAETANRIKDEFLAVLSHELRSPLNPILGWSKLLLTRTFDAAGTKQALQTIERNAKLQTQLIDDLLDVSRILQGKMALNICAVDLVTVIVSAMETVRLAAEAKAITIRFDCGTALLQGTERATASTHPPCFILGDSARLQQIVWNLLSNAVKFTPDSGQIDVSLELVEGGQTTTSVAHHPHCRLYAQIQVKDTGKGISPDFLPYVFDYFRQEDGKTTRKFGGLGLGLAIVRHLTELHGGSVHAESLGEGEGASFFVRLPLLEGTTATGEEQPTSIPSFDFTQLHILVVDDDEDMRELARVILEQQGAQVRVAATAIAALMLLEQQLPDILISDIGMPEMDGYMLMQQIRQRSPAQGGLVPAIALTAYAGEYDQQQALKVGFQRHVAKPVDPEELVRAIVDLISTHAATER